MSHRLKIKKMLAKIAFKSGLTDWLLRKKGRDGYFILMYHRILPQDQLESWVQPGMYVHPHTFETQIRFLMNCCNIVPLEELTKPNLHNSHQRNSHPKCAITFDDGWYDFYLYAYPILKKHGVPATVFLPTDYIGTDDWFWTDRFLNVIRQIRDKKGLHNKIVRISANIPDIESVFDIVQVERTISLLKKCSKEEIENVIDRLQREWELIPKFKERAFLKWEEISQISQNSHIRFGSHTAGHFILTTLTEEQVLLELKKSQQEIASRHIGTNDFFPFCYPNGNCNLGVARNVQRSGYDMGVTTKKGWNHSSTHLYQLNRIGIHQDMTDSVAMFACRICNLI
jgi:peptidoglycan/xylan/chitin deacetylase (PgdA/CDA1 family)